MDLLGLLGISVQNSALALVTLYHFVVVVVVVAYWSNLRDGKGQLKLN